MWNLNKADIVDMKDFYHWLRLKPYYRTTTESVPCPSLTDPIYKKYFTIVFIREHSYHPLVKVIRKKLNFEGWFVGYICSRHKKELNAH